MLLVYIWLYTLFLIIIWWFFIVARIHAYKFKNFSNNIVKVTNILFIILVILSLLWYWVIWFSSDLDNSVQIKNPSESFSEINY